MNNENGNKNENKATAFPPELTREMLCDFHQLPNGWTRPRAGRIMWTKFVMKCTKCRPGLCEEFIHNEYLTDCYLRTCGFNVPASREYEVDFHDGETSRTVRLSEFVHDTVGLADAWEIASESLKNKIRGQVLAAYPIQHFIAGFDTFQHDNVRVNKAGDLFYVDNGCAFFYQATCVERPWFWQRRDPNDPKFGYLAMRRHPDQWLLADILRPFTDANLRQVAAKIDFTKAFNALPQDLMRVELFEYAKNLNAWAHQNDTSIYRR